jgi:hypothetical protein
MTLNGLNDRYNKSSSSHLFYNFTKFTKASNLMDPLKCLSSDTPPITGAILKVLVSLGTFF